MAMPKFNQEIRNIIKEEMGNKRPGCEGIIVGFHPDDRSVDVVINSPNSQKSGEFLHKVALPINLGVQGMDPITGQYCFVTFRDGNPRDAFISAMYPSDYKNVEKFYHEEVSPIIPRFPNKF
jgi:hypothetical protein